MGAGVRDAMNLSWKIAGVLSGDLPEPVLDSYEVERKPHARAMIRLARLIGISMTKGGKAGDLLRQAVAPRLHLIPGLRVRLLNGETPPLRWSELVHRGSRRRSLNGRLCPNSVVADDIRYDDVTGGGFVLVTRAPLSPQQQTLLAGRGTEVLEVAPESPLYTWLTDGNATAALVRPDFTVLRAGRDVAGLCEAAPNFLVSISSCHGIHADIATRRPGRVVGAAAPHGTTGSMNER
jgi:3-(3-hydroxy-phenyl)propionate hydroxylase